MATWAVQDAKARFSKFLDDALTRGPQTVTRRGAEAAVMISIDHWRRLSAQPGHTVRDALLSPLPKIDLTPHLPKRKGQAIRLRDVEWE